GPRVHDLELVALRDAPVGIRSYGNLAAAVLGIGGELVERFDLVQRHADDARTGSGELVDVVGERLRLDVASAGVGGRVEIHHDRTCLQRFLEREGELLAGQ